MNRDPSKSDQRQRAIRAVQPALVQRGRDWFAYSPPGAACRVGVEAATEGEARERFAATLEAWARLAELPDARPRKDYVS